jgi:ribosomal subunit interface protein
MTIRFHYRCFYTVTDLVWGDFFMNKIDVQGRDLEITRAIEQYIYKKLTRAIKHMSEHVSSARVNLSCESRTATHLVEIIVFMQGGKTLRNQTRSEDMYASIDIACGSLERQIRKIKEKNIDVKRYRSIESKLGEVPDLITAIA